MIWRLLAPLIQYVLLLMEVFPYPNQESADRQLNVPTVKKKKKTKCVSELYMSLQWHHNFMYCTYDSNLSWFHFIAVIYKEVQYCVCRPTRLGHMVVALLCKKGNDNSGHPKGFKRGAQKRKKKNIIKVNYCYRLFPQWLINCLYCDLINFRLQSSLNKAEICWSKVLVWINDHMKHLIGINRDKVASQQLCYEIILTSGQCLESSSHLTDSLMISLFSS